MKMRCLGVVILFMITMMLSACGGGGDGGVQTAAPLSTPPSAPVAVQGNVVGAAAQAPLAGDAAVIMVDEAGKEAASQVVTPANGRFSLTVADNHDYVMVFREGSPTGRTMAILVTDEAGGLTAFSINRGSPDIDFGNIELDLKKGEARLLTPISLTHPIPQFPDSDGDGVPDIADQFDDEDDDGLPDLADPFPFNPARSLKDVPVPEPVNLGLFLRSGAGVNAVGFPNVDPTARAAAIKLGNALFWDMNIGSDVQACASCHFQAGADNRARNQISPGLNAGDTTFQVGGPNQTVTAADFPFHQTNPVDQKNAAVVRDSNDVLSSQGVFFTAFTDIIIGDPFELGTPIDDPVFNVGGVNTRRVEPRNAPTVINAIFNFSNFWDGRARNIFNGVNPFGELDQENGVFVQTGGVIHPEQEIVRIPDASLASQAVGPPGSDFEMSFQGRPFAKIGKKVLAAALQPLGGQEVDPTDSVLGPLADTPTGLKEIIPGENTYVTLIKQAFQDRYWDSANQHIEFGANGPTVVPGAADPLDTNQFTQMEANFALFFGLSIQLYEATLVSDDSKFDQVMEGQASFTPEEEDGFNRFLSGGTRCSECHAGLEFTDHSISEIRGEVLPQPPGFLPAAAVEIINVLQGQAFYDKGIPNIGVTATAYDIGRGGTAPFINPLTGEPYPLSFTKLGLLKREGLLPADVAKFVPDLPAGGPDLVSVDGSFKTSSLRNIELTGGFFHNGGAGILRHVVEFYTRGGNFQNPDLNEDISEIGSLKDKPAEQANLVRFLMTLTDERVRQEMAPFDHPQLFIPAGNGLQNPLGNPPLEIESFIEIPAVGAGGRPAANLPPLVPFLNLDQVTGAAGPDAPAALVVPAPSLKDTPVPEPVNLGLYLREAAGLNEVGFPNVDPAARAAAIALGKALFWDMNVGSDVQACASCHFQAGADNRTRNQVSPGLLAGDTTFQVRGPNQTVTAADFPFHQRNPVDRQNSAVVRDVNDAMSSQGVFLTGFTDIFTGSPFELGTPIPDPVFNIGGVNTRRVEPRNAPTVINAVFNYSNFWDGRARNIFNGVNPFGELDEENGVFVQSGGVIDSVQEIVRIPDASLASQAVGPPGSDFEMSFRERPFAKIGKKILAAALKPLGRQEVDPTDSVLGLLADTPTGLKQIVAGENTYVSLIKQAFQDRYWNSPNQHITFAGGVPTVVNGAASPNNTNQFTQMEANFALFFGLAIQLYEATLISDDSIFDQVLEGKDKFTPTEAEGFRTFFGAGLCNACHTGLEFTNHTVGHIRGLALPQPPGFLAPAVIEPMIMADGNPAFYDNGIYNISVTPTADDISRGGIAPFINPLTGQPFPLSFSRLAFLKRDGLLPPEVAQFVPDLPAGVIVDDVGNVINADAINRTAVDGAFKTPGLRNVELTGGYFHNGGSSILSHVAHFYTRGGNFPDVNIANLDADIGEIATLAGSPDKQANLVEFMLTLTDERVRFEMAPFDHPQLFITAGNGLQNPAGNPPLATESLIEIPAVGASGGAPLKTFLNLDPVTGESLP